MLALKILSVIAYSREDLLNIRATSTYQHYNQEYNFPEADPLSEPPRAFELIPEADPKQSRRRGLLVRLQRRARHPLLLSILLSNVQSLDNKVDEIREKVAFQRDIRDCNIFCFTETWLSGDMLLESVQPLGFFVRRADRKNHLSGKKKGGGVCFMINDSWCNCNNIQELKSFCSLDL